MEPPKDSPKGSITFGLKRKSPELGGTRTFKMVHTSGGQGMSVCSCGRGCSYCCSRHSAVVTNYPNFLRSKAPRRVMFYSGGDWSNFPESVTSLLVKAFVDKKSAVEISIGETCFLFDFLSMVLINLQNGGQCSVSWIDESEKCFFPVIFLDEGCFPVGCWNNQKNPNMDVKVPDSATSATNDAGVQDQRKECNAPSKALVGGGCCETAVVKTEVIEEASSDNGAFPVSIQQFTSIHTLCPELVKLERDSRDFIAVMRTFFSGFCNFADPTCVMAIYRYNPKTSCTLTRRENFEQNIICTRYRRGNENVQYGWFGTSREGALQILHHGFCRGTEVSEDGAYGTGVYLMPENRSFASVKNCDDDENGAQYMLLCRVTMGNTEKILAGSKQYFPSSPEFDTGVDDLLQPNCYVVWGAHMATHIHPEFIVNFKLSPTIREYVDGLKDVKSNDIMVTGNQKNVPINYPASRPRSPWISFTLLFAVIKDKVSPSAMGLLNFHLREFKNKMISRGELLKKIRSVVGDPLLLSTLKMLQQNPSSYPSRHTNDDNGDKGRSQKARS